ncbi:MAG: hypothetical protein A2365_00520 [Candidatus Nealsonbacteria bacterium RIFOXYB1_FULL_40_15]|uniref:Spore protein YkvP/CgeB glycosyl transferase-like domain-containing protein n=2 Tax=Candidatus Nealsoniibacteriota TaxID=1817911 RepID=A0A1G2ESG3_9BACT|nr:MAG: hypothetical protein A2365_00520 [Candidatus Nealsonbacteria bacterium RIFOXYB1_FULL_40_15]OGZ28754.1 MAG: hypothetical protein A2427_01700 [Candidatus Nealsonbacteria bacterium RIFOXYC1_FULL_40_7]OGZ29033.1 MAG: hypothetical protein A2562_00950 [Candidatus Nealsonbacteria bacterium RIFOXYD1_FULL_39_11]
MTKILYIALKYDYGDPKRGFGFEHYNFYDSLVNMGNEVVYFPFDEAMINYGKEKMNELLLETARKENPDLCFFFLFGDEIKKETVKKISSEFLTFNWFADDHWRFYNFSRHWASCFTWAGTTDSEAPEKYNRIGIKNVIKTQWACNHFIYKPLGGEKRHDVSFVGQPHGNRPQIIEKLRKAGINVKCWGKGWPAGRISQDEMIKIFSESRINLNLTKSSKDNLIKSSAKIFLSGRSLKINPPKTWIDNFRSMQAKKREQIKGRTFEIPGCGGFMITGKADNIGEYYKENEEIVLYKNTEDLINKIKYYLKAEKEREEIAEKGYKRTLKEHTYEKRFQDIFRAIGVSGYSDL